jgi:ATP-dependent Clp protease adaptor protein ClpS
LRFDVDPPLPKAGAMPYFPGLMLCETPQMAGPRRDDEDAGDGAAGTGLGVATRTRTRTKQPTPYRVLMLNDDYTPMEFVVLCLQRFFRMSMEEATRVMLHVHQKGVGVCGTFSYEVAETKVGQVIEFARANQHPLQ